MLKENSKSVSEKSLAPNNPRNKKGKPLFQYSGVLSVVGLFATGLSQNRNIKQLFDEQLILKQIDAIRKHLPRCGCKNLFIMLKTFFEEQHISMGRDKFCELQRRNKLLVSKTKRSVHTTNSKHHFRCYPNPIKDFTPLKAHELWVADITYIPLKNRFAYLFLITDA